jgi:hypothetical protein
MLWRHQGLEQRDSLCRTPAYPRVEQVRVYRRRKGEAKGFGWSDYRDLIIATHRSLSAPPLGRMAWMTVEAPSP